MAAVGQMTRLTSLALICPDNGDGRIPTNISCLSALVGLQSLSLEAVELNGLPLIVQACSGLTQLKLHFVSVPLPLEPPAQPQAPQTLCSCPSLVGLSLQDVRPGVISHLLPTPQAIPQLARLPEGRELPAGWPTDLNVASLCFLHESEEATGMERLAADAACLAAISGTVPCRGVQINSARDSFQLGQLSAALGQLGPFLTHLSIEAMFKPKSGAGWSKALALTLPGLQVVRCSSTKGDKFSRLPTGISQYILHSSTLQSFTLGDDSAGDASLSTVVAACFAVHFKNPNCVFRMQLPFVDVREGDDDYEEADEAMQAAVQLWRDLAGEVAVPSSVVVVDSKGRDLLDSQNIGYLKAKLKCPSRHMAVC